MADPTVSVRNARTLTAVGESDSFLCQSPFSLSSPLYPLLFKSFSEVALPPPAIQVLVYRWWVHLREDKRDAFWFRRNKQKLFLLGANSSLSLLFPATCLWSDMFYLLHSCSSHCLCSMLYWCSSTPQLLPINALLFCSSFWWSGCNQT